MGEKGLSYDEALKNAPKLGFVEADPTNDVTGKDAAYSIVILSKFAFGTKIVLMISLLKGSITCKSSILNRHKQWVM